ncbi:MAG: SMP-30/gluconolactonase/LRE family protein [Pyrinomonadaceae bacterium]|nr:SMP-30/gluconolactonase/LRE family protein [Pyrinomonadaceae bacterium]
MCLAYSPTKALANNNDRPFGDVQVLATVPTPPGFPEGIAVKGNKVYVAGPASFDTAGTPPSKVFAYDIKTGALERTYTIIGEQTQFPHANSCIAFDGDGRLYIVNLQLGIVRLNVGSGQQEIYAGPVPDIAPCPQPQGTPCSPTAANAPPLPNDIAFDKHGNLYLTDSFQATIWRIPPGGGQPQVWFQDSRLDTPFGPNGLRLSPDRTKIFFAVTAEGIGPFGEFLGGKIYTLPLVNAPTAASLQVFHQYNGEAPDGIAFGKSGKLYVVEAAPFNSGISILSPNGTEIARLTNPPGSPIFPYDSPANAAFGKHGSLLVTNHAFATMIPQNFTVLDVFVDDKESPLVKPNIP